MLDIKILGPGCANCEKLAAETKAALDAPGIEYELTKITDYGEIASYGILSTPGLVINDKVVSSGKIPKRPQIVSWAVEAQG